MFEHTPTPWVAEQIGPLVKAANGEAVAFIYPGTLTDAQWLEIKCAIAAVPEMLHALKLAYTSWMTGKPIPGVDLCAVIGQAMRKTEGR